MSTIFALSSGQLPSGVAVIRITGPQSKTILTALAGTVPAERVAARKTIRLRNGDYLDSALVLSFSAPRSFTGEDCAEIHLHGGRAVVLRVLHELASFEGTRPAEAGEFTRRAFLNGKLDLVEAEGLSDLLAAETEMQRRLAAEQSRGGLSDLYRSWTDRITFARAMIEAELDFADEDDIPDSVSDTVWKDMTALSAEIEQHLSHASVGEIIRDGLKVAIIGPPNAGKSSLMNALARRDVAIVTAVPGTTRDILSVQLDIHGFAVTLLDTAGIRQTSDLVEEEGIRRARLAAEEADIVLSLFAPDQQPVSAGSGRKQIRVRTKSDEDKADGIGEPSDIAISSKSGEGLEQLLALLIKDLEAASNGISLAIPSRIRHVKHLEECARLVGSAARSTLDLDVRAELLRQASRSIGSITGHVDAEGLLDVIFSRFCIGK